MFISVLICTRNRATELERAIASLLSPPNLGQPDWELLVVDNGSSDATPGVCQSFTNRFPEKFRYMVETRPGKSNALNTGLAALKGEIIALTDDDVLCDPGFVAGIREVFSTTDADAAQGRVLLDLEIPTPNWFEKNCAALVSERNYGDKILEWKDNLSGCNMILRRAAIERAGGFSPQIGAGAAGFMEDSEFSMRVRRNGCKLVYAPQILVRHQIQRASLTKANFRDRNFRWGRSAAFLNPLPAPLWRFGIYTAKECLFLYCKSAIYSLTGRAADAFREQCSALYRYGFFYQHHRFAKKLETPFSSEASATIIPK